MNSKFSDFLTCELDNLKQEGLYKSERIIQSPQEANIVVNNHEVINLCANNYLGLASDRRLIASAKQALDEYGYGMASVRFICGTQTLHKELEASISHFLEKEDTILYSSCFDANTGLFETLLSDKDAIISDELNHASIIDGIRLCKAQRLRYKNNDMADLEEKLKDAKSARFRMIATDGVFSMDGILANLPDICELARKYDALVMVDDSHAVGFMGKNGKGTPEHFGVEDEVDILTGTLGKALGGGSGGYTSASAPIVDYLRQRSRPYLFSNSLPPVIVKTSLEVLQLIKHEKVLMEQLRFNTTYMRDNLTKLGFNIISGIHPIIPVMLYDAKLANAFAQELLNENIYVIAFSYPVVPKDKARIRLQMSSGLTKEHLDTALNAFEKVGKSLNII